MNAITGWDQRKKGENIGGERRKDRRYALQLDVRWKLIRRRRILDTGIGKTVDFSSSGILIEVEREMPTGMNLELSVSWPVMLRDVAPLQLVVFAKVIRTHGRKVAVQMLQHEFRTMAASTARSDTRPASPVNPMSFASRQPMWASRGRS